jgi:hypothetical protein
MNVLGPSLAPYIRSSRTLKKYVTPIAHWYADLMGYRKMGLKYDDLRACLMFSLGMFNLDWIHVEVEESPQVQRVSCLPSFCEHTLTGITGTRSFNSTRNL